MCNTKKHILRRGLALLNPYNTGIFTINIIIFQSRKLAILVTAYHDEFVQCVSPNNFELAQLCEVCGVWEGCFSLL